MSVNMNFIRRSVWTFIYLCLTGLGSAAVQVYPSRPITMIVPYPAGGQGDTIGRIMAGQFRQGSRRHCFPGDDHH
jgi:tripartite-type tricarboxylate transporter receptor subunit TctC